MAGNHASCETRLTTFHQKLQQPWCGRGRGKSHGRWILRLIALVLLVVPGRLSAEIMVGHSLEAMVAGSDVIARCRLFRIVDDDPASNEPWQRMEFEVIETFKGEPGPHIFIRMYAPGRQTISPPISASETPILFFRNTSSIEDERGRRSAKYPLYPADFWQLPLSRPNAAGQRTPIALTADLRVLRAEDEIEHALRAAVAADVGPPIEPPPAEWGDSWFDAPRPNGPGKWCIRVNVSFTAIGNELYGGSAVYLTLPGDARTEALGFEWARDRQTLRRAIEVLRFFRSDRSIALFRSLLSDSVPQASGYGGPAMTWRYPEREDAYRTLRAWGVDVDRPPLNMPDEAYRRISPVMLGMGLAAALLLLVLASRLVRRRWAFRRCGYFTATADALGVLLIGIAGFVALVGGTEQATPELTTSIGNSQVWVWLANSKLTAGRAIDWEFPRPLSVAIFAPGTSPPQRWGSPWMGNPTIERKFGFERFVGTMTAQISTSSYGGPGRPSAYAALSVPRWAVLIVLLAWPTLRVILAAQRARRRSWRRRHHRCVECGYDLRASPAGCPECGVTLPVMA